MSGTASATADRIVKAPRIIPYPSGLPPLVVEADKVCMSHSYYNAWEDREDHYELYPSLCQDVIDEMNTIRLIDVGETMKICEKDCNSRLDALTPKDENVWDDVRHIIINIALFGVGVGTGILVSK